MLRMIEAIVKAFSGMIVFCLGAGLVWFGIAISSLLMMVVGIAIMICAVLYIAEDLAEGDEIADYAYELKQRLENPEKEIA